MRVAIVGSREFPDLSLVRDYVMALPEGTEVVSGGAIGVDLEAIVAAGVYGRNLPTRVFPADWKRYGKAAGFFRNQHIVDYADRIVAFWDGKSSGTRDTIRRAKFAGKPVEIIYPQEESDGRTGVARF